MRAGTARQVPERAGGLDGPARVLPLARHRTVVRYDPPGCGLSDPSPDPPSLDVDLQVLAGVVDHLGLDRFDLLGISMGAPASIAFAVRHPDRVGRLVPYGGFANGQELGPAEARAAMMDLIRAHWGLAVALMAGVSAQLARTALVDPLTNFLAIGTLGILLRWRPNPTWLIAAGATIGLLRGWFT